ncbi:hypothetical protein KAFR_0G00230 [Kazachstania africana CBS 2517]|uniref:Ribosomal RNA-processing protein 43 n=1 Tax=Kazachstania africana (strain ATCC 22294 / BCRC 22015 / CBS 2517 / CECT 1963 / NBRC 1671 / NRRL Y-8276) TaxID=1071382 RepID=H2AXF6_KAZAF|nr:hypothetical protein KAFR_0G00230 [Kazachstania africana CBS 2517]CCF59056.1 hypothetical protein KAFR_0G00230 [Kazachstania africana CBS 2517]
MNYMEAETVEVQPITLQPEVLARISPELSFQRHLSLGFRPSLRGFEEFRDVELEKDSLSRYSTHSDNNVIGSSVVRSGDMFCITKITGGIIEDFEVNADDDFLTKALGENSKNDISRYASVHPVVEVERGRMGACTDEEMTVSQKLYDGVLHSRLIPKKSLAVNPGIRTTDENGEIRVIYPDEQSKEDNILTRDFQSNKKWSYVLYAKIQVFSRTGPVFDLCWNSLIYAIRSVKLPRAFIDERAVDLKMTVRTKGRSATIKETYDILCDPEMCSPLELNEENISFASNYGITDIDFEASLDVDEEDENMEVMEPKTVLIADIDTESEETSIKSIISIIGNERGNLKHVSVIGGGSKVTPDMIKRALLLSKERAKDLSTKI